MPDNASESASSSSLRPAIRPPKRSLRAVATQRRELQLNALRKLVDKASFFTSTFEWLTAWVVLGPLAWVTNCTDMLDEFGIKGSDEGAQA